jgi:hypothetical protein
MQKLINVLAVLSFVGVSGIIGTGAAVYLNREALAEQARERITKAAAAAITDALPGMLDSAVPSLPSATEGPVPIQVPGL